MIPCIALVVGAGYGLMKAYDDFWSSLLVASGACWLGMWLGSIFGMLFARHMFRKTAVKMAKKYKVISAFDMAMDTDGMMFLIIMRICPLIPFAIQNYIIGATSMKMKHFWITGLFMVPWTVMMVFYGTTLSNIHDAVNGNYETGPVGLAAMIVGSVMAILASIFLSIVVKRHLNNMVKDAGEKTEVSSPAKEPAEGAADNES